MTPLQKNIVKTVLILVAIMATILALFLNKITTPRYLSNIELKINGLILIKEKNRSTITLDSIASSEGLWVLIPQNKSDKEMLDDFHKNIKKSVREKFFVGDVNKEIASSASAPSQSILIVRPNGELMAYFKPPYDDHKMILTLSSVVTHR